MLSSFFRLRNPRMRVISLSFFRVWTQIRWKKHVRRMCLLVIQWENCRLQDMCSECKSTVLKQNEEHTRLMKTKVTNPMLEHRNNNDAVTPVIPNVLQYLVQGYDISIVDYLVVGLNCIIREQDFSGHLVIGFPLHRIQSLSTGS